MEGIDMIPEQTLLSAAMIRRVNDAIWPLDITHATPIEEQKKALLKRKMRDQLPSWDSYKRHDYWSAISWLESSQLNEFAEACDLGTEFVKRTFDLVQDCLTWKKQHGLNPDARRVVYMFRYKFTRAANLAG